MVWLLLGLKAKRVDSREVCLCILSSVGPSPLFTELPAGRTPHRLPLTCRSLGVPTQEQEEKCYNCHGESLPIPGSKGLVVFPGRKQNTDKGPQSLGWTTRPQET